MWKPEKDVKRRRGECDRPGDTRFIPAAYRDEERKVLGITEFFCQ